MRKTAGSALPAGEADSQTWLPLGPHKAGRKLPGSYHCWQEGLEWRDSCLGLFSKARRILAQCILTSSPGQSQELHLKGALWQGAWGRAAQPHSCRRMRSGRQKMLLKVWSGASLHLTHLLAVSAQLLRGKLRHPGDSSFYHSYSLGALQELEEQ